MEEVKIRALKVDDVFPLVEIIGKVIQSTENVIPADIEAAPGALEAQKIGKSLLMGIAEARNEIKGWLADLCGMTAGEFDEQPPVFLLDVIEQLIIQKDFKDFFGKALKYTTLLSKRKPRASGKTLTQSPPATDGQTNTSAPSDMADTDK